MSQNFPTDSKSALYTVCFFLAQSGEPHVELGFETQTAAFEEIAHKFGVPANTVKNERDAFDNFTDSNRTGWKKELAPRLTNIFETHSSTPREMLKELTTSILSQDWINSMPETLLDLEDCQNASQERVSKIPLHEPYTPTNEIWNIILDLYKAANKNDKPEVVGGTALVITTKEGHFLTISAQEIPRCWAVRPYVHGIIPYYKKLHELAKALGFEKPRTGRAKEEIFKPLPDPDWETVLHANDVASIKNAIKDDLQLNQIEQERFLRFLSDKTWSGVGKTLERTDWSNNAILSTGGWLVNAADRRAMLAITMAESIEFEELMARDLMQKKEGPKLGASLGPAAFKGGENVIFYGAPGTGKSNKVDGIIKKAGKEAIRTVFHPDLQNSDFFGCLKPHMDGDNVLYEFAPGPFMEALAEAYQTPSEPAYLVIEELNRATAAAVFGDLFLLLDRDENGIGDYTVSFPSPESRNWFGTKINNVHEHISLPSNLFIYATMNSADQGVFPIDTAFRRRWRQEYLPLDYTSGPEGNIAYVDAADKKQTLEWRIFVKVLNNHLISNHALAISEDRLLGQWFVKKNELDGATIPEKVLLYLWDDLLRHEGRDRIFDTNRIKTYGALAKITADGSRFLSDSFLNTLNVASIEVSDEAGTDKNVGN
ncbi:MAG: AAA family ATPase [Hyphomicrobiales bacterium]